MKRNLLKSIGVAAAVLLCSAACGKGAVASGGSLERETHSGYGSLTIGDVSAWIGYPASEFVPRFEKPQSAEPLRYEYDAEKLTISAGARTVTALAEGTFEVKATSEHFSAAFSVRCLKVDKTDDVFTLNADWSDYVRTLENQWGVLGTDDKTTLFIGDSFFDVRWFWTNFYDLYNGKDALCFGIGSTTSYSWETLSDSFLCKMKPKNIVMHVGTNNVYDRSKEAGETAEALQRMFVLMHGRLPDTKLYYFSITQLGYGTARDEINIVKEINARMQAWCEERSWITFLDTSGKLTRDKLKDKIHPKLEYYGIFTDALDKSDIEIL